MNNVIGNIVPHTAHRPELRINLGVAKDTARRINTVAAALGLRRNQLYLAILDAFAEGRYIDRNGNIHVIPEATSEEA